MTQTLEKGVVSPATWFVASREMRVFSKYSGLTTALFLSALCVFVLVCFAIAWRSLSMGIDGLRHDLSAWSRLYSSDRATNIAMFGHMVTGGLVTAGVAAQLLLVRISGAAWLHRLIGWALCAGLVLTSLGGFAYILRNGTVGGPLMTFSFSIYGALILVSVWFFVRHARAGQYLQHRNWALRLVCLALAGVFYRLHYWLWDALIGGGRTATFNGWFDQIQLFSALPYMIAVEVWIYWSAASRRTTTQEDLSYG